jgi:hypothetical protein
MSASHLVFARRARKNQTGGAENFSVLVFARLRKNQRGLIYGR